MQNGSQSTDFKPFVSGAIENRLHLASFNPHNALHNPLVAEVPGGTMPRLCGLQPKQRPN
jgi:hypothetical protein